MGACRWPWTYAAGDGGRKAAAPERELLAVAGQEGRVRDTTQAEDGNRNAETALGAPGPHDGERVQQRDHEPPEEEEEAVRQDARHETDEQNGESPQKDRQSESEPHASSTETERWSSTFSRRIRAGQ